MDNALNAHTPVLLNEVLTLLSPRSGARILDCTVGLGGHACALLQMAGDGSTLVALDADSHNLAIAKENMIDFADRTEFIHANFCELSNLHLGMFDVILADLGISSVHLDDPAKGFSFRRDGPLDMRLDQTRGESAADIIKRVHENDIADILFHFGEIHQSRKLANAIKIAAPTSTTELAAVCEKVFSYRAKGEMPKVFQAFRIAVNNELEALDSLLLTAPQMLKPGGRLGFIAFHSLEDRKVKETCKRLTTPEINDTTGQISVEAPFTLITKKVVKPSDNEIQTNPRARSARFRVIQKREAI